mgnify:CR=1 FL=1
MQIFDCTTYFEEDLMMDLRFNILNDFVDKFVISEATFTHSGQKKKINFNPNHFKKFKHKIIHIIVENDPAEKDINTKDPMIKRSNSIKRIEFQRNELIKGLEQANENDYIIYSDNDEIPNLSEFSFLKNSSKIILFKQKLYYYKFNLFYPKLDWFGSKSCKKKDLIDISWLRNIKPKKYNFYRADTILSKSKYINLKIIENGGWHFTNLKTANELYQKYLNDEMHSEFERTNVTIEEIKKRIEQKYISYDHFMDSKLETRDNQNNQFYLKKVNLDQLPKYISINKDKYREWIET